MSSSIRYQISKSENTTAAQKKTKRTKLKYFSFTGDVCEWYGVTLYSAGGEFIICALRAFQLDFDQVVINSPIMYKRMLFESNSVPDSDIPNRR